MTSHRMDAKIICTLVDTTLTPISPICRHRNLTMYVCRSTVIWQHICGAIHIRERNNTRQSPFRHLRKSLITLNAKLCACALHIARPRSVTWPSAPALQPHTAAVQSVKSVRPIMKLRVTTLRAYRKTVLQSSELMIQGRLSLSTDGGAPWAIFGREGIFYRAMLYWDAYVVCQSVCLSFQMSVTLVDHWIRNFTVVGCWCF